MSLKYIHLEYSLREWRTYLITEGLRPQRHDEAEHLVRSRTLGRLKGIGLRISLQNIIIINS